MKDALAVQHRRPPLAVAPVELLHDLHRTPVLHRMPATLSQARQAFAQFPE
jgi:hypothetical protein